MVDRKDTSMRRACSLGLTGLIALAAAAPVSAATSAQLTLARQKIKHVIIIMQENHSFDTYFGTFPGADGIPAGTCVPVNITDATAGCITPFHNTATIEAAGPHTPSAFVTDFDKGKMDGFVYQQLKAYTPYIPACANPTLTNCVPGRAGARIHDVVGYHTAAEIPNYWTYAQTFTLQDRLFESVASWSYPAHVSLVSNWVAKCTSASPLSCAWATDLALADTNFSWTYLPYLLDKSGVSWKYYLAEGDEPDCSNGAITCAPKVQNSKVPGIWNPIPAFTLFTESVTANPLYKSHVTPVDSFLVDVRDGQLPAVSWLAPNQDVSEHNPSDIVNGMNYVTTLVNAVAQSRYAADTAIFISWDDWGGFYDHVPPPILTTGYKSGKLVTFGWGFRVPGLVISPYAKPKNIDHQYLSFDNYNRFIEDIFLNGARIDPATDGRPDSRPFVTEGTTQVKDSITGAAIPVGDLLNDFNFSQIPLKIPVLPLKPQR